MLFTDILMMAWCFTLPKGRRTFHYLSIIILTTASIVSIRVANLAIVSLQIGPG